jgi:hypothetical protein
MRGSATTSMSFISVGNSELRRYQPGRSKSRFEPNETSVLLYFPARTTLR